MKGEDVEKHHDNESSRLLVWYVVVWSRIAEGEGGG